MYNTVWTSEKAGEVGGWRDVTMPYSTELIFYLEMDQPPGKRSRAATGAAAAGHQSLSGDERSQQAVVFPEQRKNQFLEAAFCCSLSLERFWKV